LGTQKQKAQRTQTPLRPFAPIALKSFDITRPEKFPKFSYRQYTQSRTPIPPAAALTYGSTYNGKK
jgi:hypothetical protein